MTLRHLRELGLDLRLGSKDTALEGFRNDEAMGEGFKPIVLGLADNDVYYIAGSDNHIALDSACKPVPAALPVVSLEK